MEPSHHKRFRSENGGYWSNPNPNPNGGGGGGGGGVSGTQACKRFNTPEGCPFGSKCRFRHVAVDGRDSAVQSLSSGGKPKPCMKFFSTSGCPFGESCHFTHYVPGGLQSLGLSPIVSLSAAPCLTSHRKMLPPAGDPSVGINGYKSKLCNRFNTAEGCRFGEKCHFAHGENDLRLPSNHSQGTFRRVPSEEARVSLPGYSNKSSGFSSAGTLGNPSSITSQGYGQVIPPGVAISNGSTNYVAGSNGGNVQVY